MAIMKIRGGDLDLVEYEFTSFSPGENIRTSGMKGPIHLYRSGSYNSQCTCQDSPHGAGYEQVLTRSPGGRRDRFCNPGILFRFS